MSNIKELQKKFSEIGLGENSERENLIERISFNFDFSKSQSEAFERIVETNNTKLSEICPIGTK